MTCVMEVEGETMFGIQPLHILIIVMVAFLIFGPKRLPELGRSLGEAINEFKSAGRELTDAASGETQAPPPQIAPPAQPPVATTDNGVAAEPTDAPKG